MDDPRKYEIDFWHYKELPNKTLVFKIHDENEKVVGYAVTSATDSCAVIGSNLHALSASSDVTALAGTLQNFCDVYYHGNSDKTT